MLHARPAGRGRWLRVPIWLGVAAALASCHGGTSLPPPTTSPAPPSGVLRLDPSDGHVLGGIELSRPNVVDDGLGAVWVSNNEANTATVERLKTSTGAVTPIALGPALAMNPDDLGVGAGSVWATVGDELFRIDPTRLRIADRAGDLAPGHLLGSIAASPDAVWVTDSTAGTLLEVDPGDLRIRGTTDVGGSAEWVAIGEGAVWVVDGADQELVQVDAESGRILRRVALPGAPGSVAAGEGAAWVTLPQLGEIAAVDPESGDVQTLRAGIRPTGIAVGLGAVWVADTEGGTVSRVDPGTSDVDWSVDVGGAPYAVSAGPNGLWVTLLRRVSNQD